GCNQDDDTVTPDNTPAPKEEENPHIEGVSPQSGYAGQIVTISGSNLQAIDQQTLVTFNGVGAKITSTNKSELKVEVPEGAETGFISLTVGAKTVEGPKFTILFPPTITSFSPDTVIIGDTVRVFGQNFAPDKSDNFIFLSNSEPIEALKASENEINFVVPEKASTGIIKLVSGDSSTISNDQLVILRDIPRENLIFFTPFNGNAIDEITGNDGKTAGPSLVKDRFGSLNNAFYFDGIDDHISYDDQFLSPEEPITFSIWVKTETLNGSRIFQTDSYLLFIEDNGKYGLTICGVSNGGSTGTCRAERTIATNDWTNITFTYDFKTVELFLNGSSFRSFDLLEESFRDRSLQEISIGKSAT
ncbi:IPT/TIG domain-containing protein, partial [Fulvivirga kasyanovii]